MDSIRIRPSSLLTICWLLTAALGFAAEPRPSLASAPNNAAPSIKASTDANALPILFIANAGQVSAPIRYMVQSPELRAGFANDFVMLQLGGQQLQVRFPGSNPNVRLEGSRALATRANFLTGSDPAAWNTDLPTYQSVVYRNLYPGIDAVYGSSRHQLKSEFIVAPNADPQLIRLQYANATEVHVTESGDLVVKTNGTELRESAPVIYQNYGAQGSQAIQGRYRIVDAQTVGFEIDDYDPALPLIIDPLITYSTYLGGSGQGAVTAVARDTQGNLYAGGWTEALDFPIMGAMQASNRGGVDAFVVKLNTAGTALLYATYIGGSGDDRVAGVAVDSSGQLILAGATASANFPLVSPVRSTMLGGKEAFVAKLNSAGSQLLYSTFLGGSNYDAATAVAADSSGNAYVGGETLSADFITLNATQTIFGGKTDAFVAVVGTTGTLIFSSFLGGALEESLGGIAVDAAGIAYVTGGTFSTNFPVVSPLQATNAGGQDVFVAKLNTSVTPQLLYSTYLGGTGGTAAAPEQANAIALDAANNMYLTGVTSSLNFPVTTGALQSSASGSRDIFIAKINAAGTVRVYSTYWGWSGFDWANGIGVDDAGNAYITGYTSSVSYANVGGVQAGFNGQYDAFVTKFGPTGNTLSYSALYGGTRADQANAIAVAGNGDVFLGGQTSSLDFPLTGPIQTTNQGNSIAWVAKFREPVVPTADAMSMLLGPSGTVTITAKYSQATGATALTTVAVLLSASPVLDGACYVIYDRLANQFALAQDVVANGFTQVTPGAGSAQNSQCTLLGAGSSASIAGTTLTLTVNIGLRSPVTASNTWNVYLYAADGNSNTGWVVKGGFPRPSVDSVTPSAATGAAQVFTFVFSDSQNANNVTGMAMLINSSFTFNNACSIVYDRIAGTIALLYDGATGSTPKPLGSIATVQNSQCAIGVATLTISGTSNILTVPLSFTGPFTGPKNIYMYGAERIANTGWVQVGTYNVMAGGVPVANGATPTSGFGSSSLFTFTVSDQGGSNFITGVAMLFSSTISPYNACFVNYDRAANTVSLSYDLLTGASPVTIGSTSKVTNSKCTLSAVNTTVSTTATTLTITVNITFLPTFAGTRNIYMSASEAKYSSGYKTIGTWTVPGTPPTVVSLTPTSGSGKTPTFVAAVSDAASSTNITQINLIVSASGLPNSCSVVYDQASETIGLYDDAGQTVTTKPMGSSATLQNSQCAIGFTFRNVSANAIFLSVNMAFKPAFAGNKTVSVRGIGTGGTSNLVQMGTWTAQ